jgi:hypothetical protein
MTNQAIVPTREDLQDFIYYRHKDAYGVKGRHYDFDTMSYDELEAEAIRIDEAANAQAKHEQELEARAWEQFKQRVRDTIKMGASNRDTAVRWILEGEGLDKEYDPGYICYCLGLSYSKESIFKKFVGV